MDPQRRPRWSPFFTTECAVAVHSRPTLGLLFRSWLEVIALNSHSRPGRFAIFFLTVLALAFHIEANANDKFLVFCPINIGDSVAKVKEYFQIAEEPKPADRVGAPEYTYHFPAYGIYIFFDVAKRVKTLRFESPFSGAIDGISVGNSKERVLKLKGEPTKRMEGMPDKTVSLESRLKLKADIIENLPDSVPKELVRRTLTQMADIDRLTFLRMEAWLYKSSERGLLRYDFSPLSTNVEIIFSDKGTFEPVAESTLNPVLADRLRNAQVTEKRLGNGATLTEVKFAGSLQPNVDLGCISISEVKSEFNPPALIYAAKKCIQQDQYSKAWALLATANGFAYYDLKRLADRSTQGARTVLTMNAFADLSNGQQDEVQKSSKKIQADPEQVRAYCSELTKIGPPTYEPLWAILHGIGAYQEPRNGHYLTNVDTKALWEEVLRNRCTTQQPN